MFDSAQPSRLHPSLANIALTMCLGMTLYEALKQFCFPEITLWQSHAMTIVFSTLVATVATAVALRVHERVHQKSREEHALRLQAEVARQTLLERTQELEQANHALTEQITRREWAEAALRQVEEKYREILLGIDDVLWSLSMETMELEFLSPAVTTLTGWSFTEIFTTPSLWPKIIHPEDRPRVLELFKNPPVGYLMEIEYRVVRRDSEVRWVYNRAKVVLDTSGVPLRIDGIISDITERKVAEDALHLLHAELEVRVQARTEELAQTVAALEAEAVERARTEAQLRASEERCRALVENTSDLVCEVTPDGQHVYLSPNYQDTLGYEPNALLQRNALEKIHPDDREHVTVEFSKPVSRALYRVRHADGQWRWLESTGKLYRTAAGEYRRVVVSRDVTERRQVEEALFLRDRAMAATSEGITITDPSQPDNPLVYVNSGFERLTGYTAAEVLMHNCRFLQGAETDPQTLVTIHQALQEKSACAVELINYRKDGTPFWNRLSITPVYNAQNQVTHFVGVQSDITERKHVERLKDDLVATVSHELRTPLTSLRGFAELMLQREYPRDKQQQFLTIIQNESVRLTELISDFLDLQRMESGRQVYHFAPLAVPTLVHNMLPLFIRDAQTHPMRIEIPTDLPLVRGDADRLLQVLMNLVSNAVKYSPQGGAILIRASQESAAVRLSITDHGMGIPQEVLPKLFSRFFRVDNRETRRIGGTGLGLALVKEIIEAHGGCVTVESQVGSGSTFSLTIPILDGSSALVANAITISERTTRETLLL